jgi:multicomponent Na+:H+ antiporter subunit G
MVVDVVSGVALVLGAFLCLVAGIGLVRLPDVFARMHAATKPATLGLLLIAVAGMFQLDDVADVTELVLVVAVQFLTAPTGAHMVGRAAYRAGGLLDRDTVCDDLAGVTDVSAAE